MDENSNKFFGICCLHYEYQDKIFILEIKHISALVDSNNKNYLTNLKNIFSSLMNFILDNFKFDEINISIIDIKREDKLEKEEFLESGVNLIKNNTEYY